MWGQTTRSDFWFIVGSQHLYGDDVLNLVEKHAAEMAAYWNSLPDFAADIKYKGLLSSSSQINEVLAAANNDPQCAGVIGWMHTFSPSKMWISGLSRLNKPVLHLNTQFNREIPWDSIDMDFMNLNQSAHGDREHGFIGARLRLPRKIVVGFWQDQDVIRQIDDFMRVSIGIQTGRNLKCARFGDNMRDVAVTEGDKIEAEKIFGWSVNYYPVGDLAQYITDSSDDDVEKILVLYKQRYAMNTDDTAAVRYQARLEAGLRKFLEAGNFSAFTSTFEDLHGLEQLEGLAAQNLMLDGYGYGAEGDWKTACLTTVMKQMAKGLSGGTSFMEDYTYHLEENRELVLGAHMLEVCPSIAKDKPQIEVHPLGIGNRKPPARLVFDGQAGPAILVSLIDMGGRMRLIVNDCQAVYPLQEMPNLPVARVMWRPEPDLKTSAQAWIMSGGAHHTVMSYSLNAQHMADFAEFTGIEFIHINSKTEITELKKELFWNDIAYKLR